MPHNHITNLPYAGELRSGDYGSMRQLGGYDDEQDH